MTAKIIFLTVGNGPRNLESSFAALPAGCFSFNKAIDLLFNGVHPFPCCLKEVWSPSLHFLCSYIHGTFLIPRWCFPSFQSLVTDFEGRFASLKRCKKSQFFHFFNLRFSAATRSLLFEDFEDFCSSNVSITCKTYIGHSLIGLSINHSLIILVISLMLSLPFDPFGSINKFLHQNTPLTLQTPHFQLCFSRRTTAQLLHHPRQLLRQKCPNTEIFLVRIFPHLV